MAIYNVGGLASYIKQLPQLFQGFREKHRHGVDDIVLIQETHLDVAESEFAERQYKSVWGFKTTANSIDSFWSPAHAGSDPTRARHGGVGILVHPHGAIKNALPWREDLWTAYRQFIQCSLQGK